MFGRARILLTIAACAVAMPAAAQAPAPTTAFDGTYAGVSRTLEGSMGFATGKCSSQGGAGAPSLAIVNGIARSAWGTPAEGSVSPQGVLVMRTTAGIRFDGQIEIEGAGEGAFSQGGDSGSLIVNAERKAVALLFAGGDQGGSNGRGLTYGNPIDKVFDSLGVDLLI